VRLSNGSQRLNGFSNGSPTALQRLSHGSPTALQRLSHGSPTASPTALPRLSHGSPNSVGEVADGDLAFVSEWTERDMDSALNFPLFYQAQAAFMHNQVRAGARASVCQCLHAQPGEGGRTSECLSAPSCKTR
jgi:hypothetical protein